MLDSGLAVASMISMLLVVLLLLLLVLMMVLLLLLLLSEVSLFSVTQRIVSRLVHGTRDP